MNEDNLKFFVPKYFEIETSVKTMDLEENLKIGLEIFSFMVLEENILNFQEFLKY
jgi:hypothetical protein